MPRTASKRGAAGSGSIRKKTVRQNGKEYTYWEARITVGYDPGTGKQKQRSVTAKTQAEAAKKLRELTVDIDKGIYLEPSKLTVSGWLDIWQETYLNNVKPRTLETYQKDIKNHIVPALGAIKLEALTTPKIQEFYNELLNPVKKGASPLSPKTIKLIHGILHKALKQAVSIGYLRFNPSEACILPRATRKELKPMNELVMADFMAAIQGHPDEIPLLVTLFTGMRKGELLGLTWSCVDFAAGTILIDKQLQRYGNDRAEVTFHLVTTKNGKSRKLTPAPFVMKLLRSQRAKQAEWRLRAGASWQDRDLVFTDELGGNLTPWTIHRHYKHIVAGIGRPELRFHDLRHTYAVAAIRAGDDIKTVQYNMGHATAAFTLDVYGHVTDQMQQASAARMENLIRRISTQ